MAFDSNATHLKLVRKSGFEPLTLGFVDRCSYSAELRAHAGRASPDDGLLSTASAISVEPPTGKAADAVEILVPQNGIEPLTRSFSSYRSTD